MGKPTVRTKKLDDAVLSGLREGVPLAELCRRPDMPNNEAWQMWCKEDRVLANAEAAAREEGFDVLAAQILAIVDTLNEEPASRRLRAEYRLKLLSKWDPKRYGERVDLTSSDGSCAPTGLAHFYGGDGV
jgi:hypothetical protein